MRLSLCYPLIFALMAHIPSSFQQDEVHPCNNKIIDTILNLENRLEEKISNLIEDKLMEFIRGKISDLESKITYLQEEMSDKFSNILPEVHDIKHSIGYSPVVSISLGCSLDPHRIKEGDDVYFECDAQAKPCREVIWTHNGARLSSGRGVLVSNTTLVLQHVTRAAAGNYTCEVHYSQGQARSQPLNLDIKYVPVCSNSTVSPCSLAKHEQACFSCAVLANPDEVSFTWVFKRNNISTSVPSNKYAVQGTESVLNYTFTNPEVDNGTLFCWAENTIGKQENPCVFQLLEPDLQEIVTTTTTYHETTEINEKCLASEGFFTAPYSEQCYKIFHDEEISWEESDAKCKSHGLVLAKPDNAVELRKYIVKKLKVNNFSWIGGRDDGVTFRWVRDQSELRKYDSLWYPGYPKSRTWGFHHNWCLLLATDKYDMRDEPYKPYYAWGCDNSANTICEKIIV